MRYSVYTGADKPITTAGAKKFVLFVTGYNQDRRKQVNSSKEVSSD